MHYLLKAIMICIGLVLELGNMQWNQSKFIATYQEVQSFILVGGKFNFVVSLNEWMICLGIHLSMDLDDLIDVLLDVVFVPLIDLFWVINYSKFKVSLLCSC